MSTKTKPDGSSSLVFKSSIVFFLFGSVVAGCLFTVLSRFMIILEGSSRQVGTFSTSPVSKSSSLTVTKALGMEGWPGMDYHGMREWPITVRDKPVIRPGMVMSTLF